jgi:hypothetical protein
MVTEVGADNDQHLSGTLQLFNPSSTTFVKHFISDCQFSQDPTIQKELLLLVILTQHQQ